MKRVKRASCFALAALTTALVLATAAEGCGAGTTGDDAGAAAKDGAIYFEASGGDASLDSPVGQCPIFRDGKATTTKPACDACLATACCDQATGCFGNATCIDLNDCIGKCNAASFGGDAQGPIDCANACYASHGQAATDAYNAFIACYQGPCDASCH